MKLNLALTLFASFGAATFADSTYYSQADFGDSTDAAAFCGDKGQVLATTEEWCAYATANTGVLYGSAAAADADGCVDVEDVCGIPKPTDAPTKAPTAAPVDRRTIIRNKGIPRGGGRSSSFGTTSGATRGGLSTKIKNTSAVAGRGRGFGRNLESVCPEQTSVLCSPAPEPLPAPKKASGSGDPHLKTWTGDKYDYHGECDLVLIDNPTFSNGLGLKLHIRTTRIKYFSYIERVALQIGNDVLEFANDVDGFLINGKKVEDNHKHHKTMFAGFVVRRDPNAISIRLQDEGTSEARKAGLVAKIDLHTRKNGFPAVIVDGGKTDVFKGSLGLLGEWSTGKRIARDGVTEMNGEDATPFALEWQVRDTEPMLFAEARFPQFPTQCVAPKQMLGKRLGDSHMKKEAEMACAHWTEDKDDCIFDVMATRDIMIADEGHITDLI